MRLGAAFAALVALGLGCGGPKPLERAAIERASPHWQDVFDRTPAILIVARPQAISHDKVYGPLLKTLSRMVAARAPRASGPRTIEVLESCEEVIYGVREGGARSADDAVVALRGVRADVDPMRLVDDGGRALWRAAGAVGRVQELASADEATPASLFLLPARTWVVAIGDARERARSAFVNPFDRPSPVREDGALLYVRLDGTSLVEAVPRLRARGGALEPAFRHLGAMSFALRSGGEGVIGTFEYTEEAAAAFAEAALRDVATALAQGGPEGLKWLGAAKLDRQASTVTARVPLPPRLIAELPAVSGAELNF